MRKKENIMKEEITMEYPVIQVLVELIDYNLPFQRGDSKRRINGLNNLDRL